MLGPDQFDLTKSPEKRKLGDIVTLKEAMDYIQSLNPAEFDYSAFNKHKKRMRKYFNHPYTLELHNRLGFPYDPDEQKKGA